jgi:5-methylcytosine-specific restriction protein A
MSKAPPRPCRKPGCRKLSKDGSGWCEEHRGADKKQADVRRGTATERGYDWQWQKARKWKLRESPLCERCIKPRPAELVHHRDRNPRNNAQENLESLCQYCHEIEHKDERWRGRAKSSEVRDT